MSQLPHVVCGDFDSISPDTLRYFESEGAQVIHDEDQYTTDLMKALGVLEKKCEVQSHAKMDVVISGGLEGRVDQALSQLHQLYLSSTTKGACVGDIYLMTQTSIVMLLEKHRNEILAPVSKGMFTQNVGIVPLAGPVTLTTSGFEWNLKDDKLEFGRFISTSNHIVRDTLEVETCGPILLTLEMDCDNHKS